MASTPLSLLLLLWLVVWIVLVNGIQEEKEDTVNKLSVEITACNECRLSQWQAVESFLTQGDAESYRGVSVLFVSDGRDPTMVVTDQDDNTTRKIPLKDYNSKDRLIALFEEELGLAKRTGFELRRYKQRQRKLQAEQDRGSGNREMEEISRLERKQEEIAERVRKMQQENLKKAEEQRRIQDEEKSGDL